MLENEVGGFDCGIVSCGIIVVTVIVAMIQCFI